MSSFEFEPKGFLDEEEQDEVVLCQVKYFMAAWASSSWMIVGSSPHEK